MRIFRVFISSPGDTLAERRRAESVVSRLNGEFAGLARLVAVRWETEFYGAHETFQAQIPPSVECDIVIGILRWRLGTELPPGFEAQPGGEPYPSGTAYEILTAIEKRKTGGELPDVFVFRYTGGAPSIVIGESEEAGKRRDWTALQGFFARWFVTEQGHFTAALNSYASEDAFEHQVETLLRKWVAERVSGGRVVPWPAVKGSPFRGLDVFGARHAPVFFGRAADIRKATDLWRQAGTRKSRFLLVVGASGAGKSSLVRAGLVPRLTTPGVVPEVDLWRVAVLRPADGPDGPFMALAAALLRAEADLPAEEEGRGPALPEIAEGDSKTPADLAGVLAHADAGAARVIVNALARVSDQFGTAERYDRPVRCDLVLVLDQAEELFAPSVAPDLRARFAALLEALVASGRVWLAATLRADLYAAWLDVPVLKALKDAGAAYDLAPPGVAELAEIVRAPATAAALGFDRDTASGESLDEILLREADRPDMLPLVQLALSRLWEARETRGTATVLPLAAFRTLGGLKGIIAEAGETAIGRLDPTRLPPLIRRLAELSHGRGVAPGTLTTRAVPLGEAASEAASRALVDALVTARLLTLSDEGGITVRLAHQRVLSDWPRAAAIVADSADFYRVRDAVEAQRQRWEAARRRGDLLLPRGLPLAEARATAAKYGAELPPETLAYVSASRRRANRAQIVAWSAAAVFALVAIGAGVIGKVALDEKAVAETQTREAERQRTEAELQKQAAEKSFGVAKAAVDGLVFDIAEGLSSVGLPVATTEKILETARATVDQLLLAAPADARLQRSRAIMLENFGHAYETAGNLAEASSALLESLAILRRLAAEDPGNAKAEGDVPTCLSALGDVRRRAGDAAGALAADQESLDLRRGLVARNPGDAEAQRNVSISLEGIGDVKRQTGDAPGALAAYREDLAISRKLAERDPGSARAERDLSTSLERIGDMEREANNGPGALAAFQESVDLTRKLAAQNPGDAGAQRDLSICLNKVGDLKLALGDTSEALAIDQESLEIFRKLAVQDPGNVQAQRDLSLGLNTLGDAKLRSGDGPEALAAFRDDLAIARRLMVQDPANAEAQSDLSLALLKTGDASLKSGEPAAALAAYQESLDIRRTIAAQAVDSVLAQQEVSQRLNRVGNMKSLLGDQAGALAAFQESLAIRRRLAARDPGDVRARQAVLFVLNNMGDVALELPDGTRALAAYEEALAISRDVAAHDPGNAQAQRAVSICISKIGDVKLKAGDPTGALAAYQEGLDLRRAYAARNLGSAEAQRDVVVGLTQIAKVRLDGKDRGAALSLLKEALGIAERLASLDPNDEQARSDLDWVRRRIDSLADADSTTGEGAGTDPAK